MAGREDDEKDVEEYVELGPEPIEDGKANIIIRPFVINDFDDIQKKILYFFYNRSNLNSIFNFNIKQMEKYNSIYTTQKLVEFLKVI